MYSDIKNINDSTQIKKVLMVSAYIYPKIGGVERYVYELSKQLMLDDKYQVVIVTANIDSDKYIVTNLDGIEVHHIPTKYKFSNTPIDLSTYFWIKKVIEEVRPDIIHAHAPVPFFSEMAALNSKDIKLVLSYHSGSLRKGVWYIDALLFVYERLILQQLFKRADAITTVSEATLTEMFSAPNFYNKATLIPPGVHISNNVAHIKDKSDIITYVGRVEISSSWKGIDVLIKAFAKALKQKPHLKLQIVGDGDAVPVYKKLAVELGISDSTIFTGSISADNMVRIYHNSSLVVLPSVSSAESFGMVLLEAMSCGVPVIGSRIGGIVNLITDSETGLLFEPGNVLDLEESIIKMLDDTNLRDRCIKNGLQKVKTYTWEAQAQKMKFVYESLLTKPIPKVVHVVPAYPPNLGGMEQRVKELVDRLHVASIPVEVITSDIGTKPGRIVEAGVLVRRVRTLAFFQTPISFRLPFVLLSVKADLFHVHVAQPYFPIIAAFIASIRRKPYIMHIRAIVESEHVFGKMLIYVYKKVFLKIILRGAARCIILTDTYRDILVREYGVKESLIVTIPNATEFKVLQKPRTSVSGSDTVNLLAVGRLERQKNYHFMLRVMKELQTLGNFKLTIVGNGSEEQELKQYAVVLGIEDKIIWKGRLHGQELEAAYEKADIFVHTAYFEGFGTVFIEAMAKGLPICASKVLGAVDVVVDKKNGFLCSLDEVTFAKNINKFVHDPILYSELSSNNLTTVLQYRWEGVFTRTVKLYNEV